MHSGGTSQQFVPGRAVRRVQEEEDVFPSLNYSAVHQVSAPLDDSYAYDASANHDLSSFAFQEPRSSNVTHCPDPWAGSFGVPGTQSASEIWHPAQQSFHEYAQYGNNRIVCLHGLEQSTGPGICTYVPDGIPTIHAFSIPRDFSHSLPPQPFGYPGLRYASEAEWGTIRRAQPSEYTNSESSALTDELDHSQTKLHSPKTSQPFAARTFIRAFPEHCELCVQDQEFKRLRDLIRHLGSEKNHKNSRPSQLLRIIDGIFRVPCGITGCKSRNREDATLRHLTKSAFRKKPTDRLHSRQELVDFCKENGEQHVDAIPPKELATKAKNIMKGLCERVASSSWRKLARYWAGLGFDVARAGLELGPAALQAGIGPRNHSSMSLARQDGIDEAELSPQAAGDGSLGAAASMPSSAATSLSWCSDMATYDYDIRLGWGSPAVSPHLLDLDGMVY